ncbi:unnamed protein product [Calypogeia fissa]
MDSDALQALELFKLATKGEVFRQLQSGAVRNPDSFHSVRERRSTASSATVPSPTRTDAVMQALTTNSAPLAEAMGWMSSFEQSVAQSGAAGASSPVALTTSSAVVGANGTASGQVGATTASLPQKIIEMLIVASDASRQSSEWGVQELEEQHQAQLAASRRRAAEELAASNRNAEEQHQAQLAASRRRAAEELAASKRNAEEQHQAQLAASRRRAAEELAASKRNAEEQHQADLASYKRIADEELATSKRHTEQKHQAELAASKRRADEELATSKRDAEEKHQAELAASKSLAEELAASKQEQHQAELAASKRQADERLAEVELKAENDRKASQEREQAAMKDAEAAKNALQEGIQPVEWPTQEEYDAAMKQIKNDPGKFHFAICGSSGSGKSSLVNAFRGLKTNHPHAAKVGVTETTTEIGRYPDPHPLSQYVWYDIPGAGTPLQRDWQYFNRQGLFVFDLIIVVYADRFRTIDVDIIENCNRFRIPVFVVRSKADMHIQNMARDENDAEPGDTGYVNIFAEKMTKFRDETRKNFSKQVHVMTEASRKRELELDQSDSKSVTESEFESSYQDWLSTLESKIYIVAAKTLCALVLNDPNLGKSGTLDESLLVEHLLTEVGSIPESRRSRLDQIRSHLQVATP